MEFWIKILTYSLPAGRVLGIPLRINWILLLFLPALIRPFLSLTSVGVSGAMALLLGLMFVALLYGSVLLHELGHAWGGRLVGNDVHEIQLTPIGGVAMGQGLNYSPRTELIVVGLGPAVSVLLAILGWALLAIGARWWQNMPLALAFAIEWLYKINLMLAMFNLLVPIFPLDSAKILRALLSLRFNPDRTTYYLAQAGIGLSILVLLCSLLRIPLPVIGNVSIYLTLIVILGIQACIYVLQSLQAESAYATYDSWSGRPVYYDSDVMARTKRCLREDLARLGIRRARTDGPRRIRRSRFARRKSAEPARVLAVPPSVDKINNPDELRDLMLQAAEMEDFALAARLKRRLREIESAGQMQEK